ncbi:hypothetical protein WA026_017809 [Henosepilachna vigintioctopunctata]|uniref:Uncharacterized protein n=1 Tax=Henosepilachna vigintioctopunctata TaxID=420089 RepID=A0AAW1TPU2_9CUCU
MNFVKIGAIASIASCSIGFFYQNKWNRNIKQMEFYKESLNLVRNHKGAMHFLGEPIIDCRIQFLNGTKSFISDTKGLYEVKLKGSKQNGMLYINIEKDKDGLVNDWKLSRLELAIDNQPDKRLLIQLEKNEDIMLQ